MTKLYNKSSERDKRRSLRNNMPPAEKLIWSKIRNKQIEGCKFRRQYSIGAFVIDFYSPELRLALEIDGESHFVNGAQTYDNERELFLKDRATKILRFTNSQVYQDLDTVLELIPAKIQELRNLPHPYPPLAKGRE
jgi:very-short-patch-repair endonuclease